MTTVTTVADLVGDVPQDSYPKLPRDIMENEVVKPILKACALKHKCTKMAKAADVDINQGHVYVQLNCGRIQLDKLYDDKGYTVWYGIYDKTLYWTMGDNDA